MGDATCTYLKQWLGQLTGQGAELIFRGFPLQEVPCYLQQGVEQVQPAFLAQQPLPGHEAVQLDDFAAELQVGGQRGPPDQPIRSDVEGFAAVQDEQTQRGLHACSKVCLANAARLP